MTENPKSHPAEVECDFLHNFAFLNSISNVTRHDCPRCGAAV